MTSMSRIVAALPLRETTQIAPAGRIRRGGRRGRRARAVESAARKTTSVSGSGSSVGHVARPVGEQARRNQPSGSTSVRRSRRASRAGRRACRGAASCRPSPSPVSCHSCPTSPLLVFGPRSLDYDFGPSHPLTPRRFGPGIDLLRALGAEPGLAPEPATDDELLRCHTAALPRRRRSGSRRPTRPLGGRRGRHRAAATTRRSPGMHEAAAAVAGGSLRAMEAILRGDVEHAFHPGGGLHHAMPSRASGSASTTTPRWRSPGPGATGCASCTSTSTSTTATASRRSTRPIPGVLTVSIHESGRYSVPGHRFRRRGRGGARRPGRSSTSRSSPRPATAAWLAAVDVAPAGARGGVPARHHRVASTAPTRHAVRPARPPRGHDDRDGRARRGSSTTLAHRYAGGRWLATGGGGYDVYRVVPRAWSHVWLAAAHREVRRGTPEAWRERWADDAQRYGHAPLPATFDDPPNAHGPATAGRRADGRRGAVGRRAAAPRRGRPRLIRSDAVAGGRPTGLRRGPPTAPHGGRGRGGSAGGGGPPSPRSAR